MLNAAELMVVIVISQIALVILLLGVVWWQAAKLVRQGRELRRAWRAAGFVHVDEYSKKPYTGPDEIGSIGL